jgi:hypothetical protein
VTTVELSVVSYVTRATPREPYLGLRLMLDARAIAVAGAEMRLPRRGSYAGAPGCGQAPKNARVIEGDVLDSKLLDDAMTGQDIVYANRQCADPRRVAALCMVRNSYRVVSNAAPHPPGSRVKRINHFHDSQIAAPRLLDVMAPTDPRN